MKTAYYPPKSKERRFHCPHCGVLTSQYWFELQRKFGDSVYDVDMSACQCFHCDRFSYWLGENMVYPSFSPVELPHPDLPADCRNDYDEARSIVIQSPRGAAALLRLTIQKLMPHLGEKGKQIDTDIGSLVRRGSSTVTQRALDICRVVGNNAVHPGEIDLNDTPEIAHELFRLVNAIVDELIARPREIEAMYQTLPESNRKAIEIRNLKAISVTSSETTAPTSSANS
jgi:hypothetical protein